MDGYSFMLLYRLVSSYISDVRTKANKYILLLLSITFCYLVFVPSPVSAGLLEKSNQKNAKFQSQDLYHALAAEIYNKLGEDHLAVDFYYKLSVSNSDPAIAKRA